MDPTGPTEYTEQTLDADSQVGVLVVVISSNKELRMIFYVGWDLLRDEQTDRNDST